LKLNFCNPEPYIDKRVKAPLEEFKMALDGDVTPATLTKMRIIQERLDYLGRQKAELEQVMASLSKDFNRQLEILNSAPGIDSISAISIISEIGVNMNIFASVKKFLSWVGVVPQNNESAGKKKSTRIGKGNSWLKPVIIQCANAAINDKKHPEIREKYLALKKRRGHGKAIVAIGKRLMTAIYYMLLRNETYNPIIGKDTAPKRGKIELGKLIEHYTLKGYTVFVKDDMPSYVAGQVI
jgi:transposase